MIIKMSGVTTFISLLLSVSLLVLVDGWRTSPPQLVSSQTQFLRIHQKSILKASSSDSDKKFASYVIYKKKGAVAIKTVAPTWALSPNGKSAVVSREGGLFFEFAPALEAREYDWTKKLTFLMDATECGELLAKSSDGVEFVHDPLALTADSGKVMKKMKWSLSPDKSGFFASLQVTHKQSSVGASTSSTSANAAPSMTSAAIKSTPGSLSIPVSWGEFVVIESIIRHSLPKFLGMDRVWDSKGEAYEQAPIPPPAPAYKDL